LLAPGLTRFRAWFSARWQSGRLFRIGALAVGLLVAFWLLLYVTVLRAALGRYAADLSAAFADDGARQ
jgi:hypothetical protein